MSDEELAAALDQVLEKYFRGQLNPYDAMNQIARLKGEHDARKAGQQ